MEQFWYRIPQTTPYAESKGWKHKATQTNFRIAKRYTFPRSKKQIFNSFSRNSTIRSGASQGVEVAQSPDPGTRFHALFPRIKSLNCEASDPNDHAPLLLTRHTWSRLSYRLERENSASGVYCYASRPMHSISYVQASKFPWQCVLPRHARHPRS